jgi:multidrug efflux pump
MISAFFIRRPIFACVIAIVIMLGGVLALNTLSISQYPEIAPPTIQISASYPGADAQTVENSVTKIIEQGMTGLDNLDYMTATSTSTGQAEITLTFTNKANPDTAQMQVQNKLQLVTALLPSMVQSTGLTVTKSSSDFPMVIGFVSTDGRMTEADLSDYVKSALNDTLKRVEGVGNTQLFGAGYAMRIWLDPDKLVKYALTPADVVAAIQSQNTQVSAGQLGGLPARTGQQLNATVTAQSRLQTPEQFRNIILKSTVDGSLVRINDVANVEFGVEDYASSSTYNGLPATGLGISLATGANAIRMASAVKEVIDRLAPTFPQGMKVVLSLRHDAFCPDLDRGGDPHIARGNCPRLPCHAGLSPEHPRHDYSDARRAGRTAGHLRGAFRLRLFDQHAHDVRHGAGDRAACR